jgi:hypothetical protein
MHAVARRVTPETGGRMAPRAGEARPSEQTHRAVAGRARIVRTADDLINVGRQTRVIEGDDAAMMRWRQPHAERRLARALADDLAKMRPLKEMSKELWALRRAVQALQANDDATRGVSKPRGPDATGPRNTTTPGGQQKRVKGAITPVAPVGTGPGAHTVGRPQRRMTDRAITSAAAWLTSLTARERRAPRGRAPRPPPRR